MSDQKARRGNFSQNPVTNVPVSLNDLQSAGVVTHSRKGNGDGKRIEERDRAIALALAGREQETAHSVVLAAEAGYGIVAAVQQIPLHVRRTAVRTDRPERNDLGHVGSYQFAPFGKELDVERCAGRFDKDRTAENGILAYRNPDIGIGPAGSGISGQGNQYGARGRKTLRTGTQVFPVLIVQIERRFLFRKGAFVTVERTDDHTLVRISDRMADFRDILSDHDVFLEETGGVEIEHPTRISPQGVFPGKKSIGQREAVCEPHRIAFDLSRSHQTFGPVVQIDVNEIGERIGSVCHGIRQIGPEPDRVSDPVVGLVQMKVELLGMFGGLRVEKGLYPGILHSVPVFAGCLGTGVRAGKINCRT